MPEDAPLSFPELELIDRLISGLEALIHESDDAPFFIDSTDRPKRAVYRILAGSPNERKPRAVDVTFLNESLLVLRCSVTGVVRLTPVEVMVQAEKSGRGETMAIVRGKAREIKRIRGGYEIGVEVGESRKTRLTPARKLADCLRRNDAAAWNKWCQDIHGAIDLTGLDLRNADLNGYDLCCADFDRGESRRGDSCRGGFEQMHACAVVYRGRGFVPGEDEPVAGGSLDPVGHARSGKRGVR